MILLALVAALILAGCSATGGGDASPSAQKERAAKSPEPANSEKLGHPSLGEADAPVVMTEYSDYQ